MKILIAEDTNDLNHALTVAFEHNGYTVDSALDGEEASTFIQNNGYDVIILDIMMPKKDGIQVLTELRTNHVITPVLMLTAKAEIEDRVVGLDAGADDYLPKPFAIQELLARVRALTRRATYQEATIDRFEDLILDGVSLELKCENAVRLSNREFELLQYFIRNSEKEMDADTVLREIWSDSPDASQETLQLYIMYLQNKLKAIASRVQIFGEMGKTYRLEKQS